MTREHLRRARRRVLHVIAACSTAAWGCSAHPLVAPRPGAEAQTDQYAEVNPIRKLDLVFVIDNSASMREEQENLARNFPAFMRELRQVEGPAGRELPDVHIGIISTDVGAGPEAISGACQPLGDRGRFRVKPGCGLEGGQGAWLAAAENGAKTNFGGSLEDAFSCLAQIGVSGCGFEHHLQSLVAALSKENPENQGFLRPDATLAIIFVTDEDDCSAPPSSDLFLSTPDGESPNFICAKEGHTCKGQRVPAVDGFSADLAAECGPTEKGKTRLIPIEDFVMYIKGLKPAGSGRIIVSAIMGVAEGPGARYTVARVENPFTKMNELDAAPICRTAAGTAQPPLRLRAFVEAFGSDRGSIHSICQADLRDPLERIAKLISRTIGPTCVGTPLVDSDPTTAALEPDCAVSERRPRGAGWAEVPLAACSRNGGARPCWQVARDDRCAESGYKIDVQRDGAAPPGTILAMKCATCARLPDPRCPSPLAP